MEPLSHNRNIVYHNLSRQKAWIEMCIRNNRFYVFPPNVFYPALAGQVVSMWFRLTDGCFIRNVNK